MSQSNHYQRRNVFDVVPTGIAVSLSEQQKSELVGIAQSRSLPAGYVFRAKLILLLNEGVPFSAIRQRLATTTPTIVRWKERFLKNGVDGLDTTHPGQKPFRLTPALRARVLAAIRRKPKDGSTHWSCRKLAAALGISKDLVHRVWQEAGVKPHRIERYMASNDPESKRKPRMSLVVPEPAAARRSVLYRREDRDPSS